MAQGSPAIARPSARLSTWQALERPLAFAQKAPSRLRGLSDLVRTALANTGFGGDDAKQLLALVRDYEALADDDKRARVRRIVALLNPEDSVTDAAKAVAASASAPVQPSPTTQAGKQALPRAKAQLAPANAAPRAAPSVAPSKARAKDALGADVLQWPIAAVKGVGAKRAEEFVERGLMTIGDVLALMPRTYEDRRRALRIAEVQPQTTMVVKGIVVATGVSGFGAGKRRFEVALDDGTATIRLVYFQFRGGEMQKRFVRGTEVTAVGEVQVFAGKKQMVHPKTALGDGTDLLGGVHPVYSDLQGLEHDRIARVVQAAARTALEHGVDDAIPESMRSRAQVPSYAEAIAMLHLPPDDLTAEALLALLERRSPAHKRIAFEELFVLALAMEQKRAQIGAEAAPTLTVDADELQHTVRLALGFAPTAAQARAMATIHEDMASGRPMARLLQGDVGSGKTAVAAAACIQAVRAGYQAAMMAPTEILAEQHGKTLQRVCGGLGMRVEVLTGSRSKKQRAVLEARLRGRDIDIVVGTQALLSDGVDFARLGVCVVDEQHRFGVVQRAALKNKGPMGLVPHMLVMTATPIPRSLALTLYGDLSVSVLDELPPGRTPIDTRVTTVERDVHDALHNTLTKGERAYVVYPLIEESEKLDAQAAVAGFESLCARYPGHVALLHGRMATDDKASVMRAFSAGEASILVSTTVVEVGVDVPEATLMVVMDAERFGLAQIHQLRGRVGRSHRKSACLLVTAQAGKTASARLEVLEETNDGFRIAEEDLAQRGPGDLLGTRQSGAPRLAFADIVRHAPLIDIARSLAHATISVDAQLQAPEHAGLLRLLSQRYADALLLAKSG